MHITTSLYSSFYLLLSPQIYQRFTTGFLSFTFCQTTLSSLFKNSWCKKRLNEFWKYSSAERLFFQELVPSFSSRTILNRYYDLANDKQKLQLINIDQFGQIKQF
ncbi:Hypothetical_protein [Hexamita inflata]|uniref:Hypothetical_protein n=1 Tax=Hexamita inflata TaxID=28002 RepID=A0AA86Q4B1_9EUKA|nr:Hypothetical protein HINF_LOCUS33457 [Hexamita inflata]